MGYTWRDVHSDLERGHFIGTYGAHNAAYHGLAGIRAGVDMSKFHSKRSPDEFYVEPLQQLIESPVTQQCWEGIATLDPLGMFATRPTMSATTATMTIPELQQKNQLEADGAIVNPDLTINCVKCAIDLVWNLPLLAAKLQMDEGQVRAALANSTQNEHVLDTSRRAYLPPVGGITVYFFGDIAKLQEKTTEVAVRVHDECSGSDVFGTDICTCRPYLIFALQGAVQCAQRGGVGMIIYFRKEGRSLGEVTKFRVYNARKRQQGGDTAANYFKQTEGIAGIRDARFQVSTRYTPPKSRLVSLALLPLTGPLSLRLSRCALSGDDAGCAAVAGCAAHRLAAVHELRQVRRHHRCGHRSHAARISARLLCAASSRGGDHS